MDSYASSVERMAREHWIEHFAATLNKEPTGSSCSRTYFMTFRFDRYRSHYLTSSARCGRQSDVEIKPTESDVRLGMTRVMPVVARNQAFIGDIHKRYLRLLREMFGRYRERYRIWHPRGVGFLDVPVGKSPGNNVRLPGDEYLHAHILLRVDDDPSGPPTTDEPVSMFDAWCKPERSDSLSNVDRFERLETSGVLNLLWLEQNPDGKFWIERLKSDDDVRRPLDYIGKSAKKDQALFDNPILLPFERAPEGAFATRTGIHGRKIIPHSNETRPAIPARGQKNHTIHTLRDFASP